MTLALKGARIWDGSSASLTPEPVTLQIDRGRITSIDSAAAPSDGEALDLTGLVALPGLIDAHVHLTLDPQILQPDDQLKVPVEERERAMARRAETMVRAGITTARDLGGGDFRELALRDRIARGELPGPRLLCAGQPITLPRGHCHFWGGGAETADDRLAVLDRQVERGADLIKVMATGGVLTAGTSARKTQFDVAELRSLVARAAATGRHVAAHCHGTEGIAFAARAGVRTIEHCSFAGDGGFGADLDEGVVDEIAVSDAFVSPTVNQGWARRILGDDGEPTRFFRRMSAVYDALAGAGVPLIASTDAGIPGVEHHRLAIALAAFARYAGLAPVDALRAATSRSALALGLADVCGVLRPGLSADVLVVAGDPLEDLSVLERPVLTIARGRVYEPAPAPDAAGARARSAPASEH